MKISTARIGAAVLIALCGAVYQTTAVSASNRVSGKDAQVIAIDSGPQSPVEIRYLDSSFNPAKGYIVDSESVTLDGAYDVSKLSEPGPYHDIDLEWTVKNTTKCYNLGSDPCPSSGLRYPGLDCVNAKGVPQLVCGSPGWAWSGLPEAPALKCPVYKSPYVSLAPGQSVTICTSSDLFPQESASAASYSLGYDLPYVKDTSHITVDWALADPWNDSRGKPAPVSYKPWPCTKDDRQKGPKDVPPVCTDTGAFRRVYSRPGYFGATAIVSLPKTPSDVALHVADQGDIRKQAAYVYLEGWVGGDAKSTNYEFGFQYNEGTNDYTLYSHGPGYYWNPTGHDKGFRFRAGHRVRISMYAYPRGHADSRWPAVPGCKNDQRCLVVRAQDLSSGKIIEQAFDAAGWVGNSLIFARMTTIAQDANPSRQTDIFNDGAIFGPIRWSEARLGKLVPGGVHASDWSSGGEQSFPDDSSRVIVTNQTGETAETDTLDLHF